MISMLLRLLLAAGLLAGCAWAQQSVREHDAVCAKCHGDIYRKYIATPMANASGMAADRFFPGDFTHASSGVQYRVHSDAQGPSLSFADTHDTHIAGSHALTWFLGSGHLGTTYLYLQDGFLLESPVAWYASTHRYDMKPGYENATEMPSALPVQPGCLRCHMSGVSAAEADTQNHYNGLPFAQSGITCESCHGDTSAHVQSNGKASVVNPAKLAPERRDAVCMVCHLEGNVTVTRANRSQLAYQPGDRLSDFFSYFVLSSGDPLERGVSEVEQLSTSRCKRASGDQMSCLSCHDPHGSPGAEERVAFFRSKCLQCHSSPAIAKLHHPENQDCTSCHMPRNGAQNTPHVAWTDHRILREPGNPMPPHAVNVQQARLVPIFSSQADQRDRAVALYYAALNGTLPHPDDALRELKQAYNSGARDTPVLEGLAALCAIMGEDAEAKFFLKELLQHDPNNVSGRTNASIYVARQGNLKSAIQILTSVSAYTPYSMKVAHNLAIMNCAAGNGMEARRALARALSFSPGDRQAWSFACTGN